MACKNLFDMEPLKSAKYVVSSNICAAAGEWDSARETWKLMEENPGYSLVQSTNKFLLVEPC